MRRYVEWIIRYRVLVIGLTVLLTGVLVAQIRNLHIVIDPDRMLPQTHPYVEATNKVENVFGAKFVIVIGITPREGDAFQPAVLAKVQHITAALLETSGVVRANLLSFAARRAKNIAGTAEGMEVRPLMETVPHTPQVLTALRHALRTNPAYINAIVSQDERTAAVLVEFKQDSGGFRGMVERVEPIVERERDSSVEIAISGLPVFLSRLEGYSQRMGFLFPLAVLIIGLIHYEAFRTLQGLILPLVTALLAVVWGLGVMGFSGVPMDVFNASTPILILAEAAYTFTKDGSGRSALIKNPFFYLVVGGDRTFLEYLTVNLQYFLRVVQHFHNPLAVTDPLRRAVAVQLAAVTNQRDPVSHGASLRVSHKWFNETLEGELAGVLSFTRLDFVIRPKFIYALTDRWKGTVGADIFRGSGGAFFGRLQDNSGMYVELRYSF